MTRTDDNDDDSLVHVYCMGALLSLLWLPCMRMGSHNQGAAMLFEFPPLITHCVSCVVRRFSPSTLESVVHWSKLYPGSGLWDECVSFLAMNCVKLSHTRAFQSLPTDLLLALVQSPGCDLPSSKRKFEVVQAFRMRRYPDRNVDIARAAGLDDMVEAENLGVEDEPATSGIGADEPEAGSRFPRGEGEDAQEFVRLTEYEKKLFDEVAFASKIAMAAGMGDNQDHLDVTDERVERRKAVKFAADRCIEVLTELSKSELLSGDDELQNDIAYVMDTIVNNRMHEMYHGKESNQQTTIVESWLQQDKKNRFRRKRRKSASGAGTSFPSLELPQQPYELFPDLDMWQFDIFKANLDCGGTPLLTVAREIFNKYSLSSRFCPPGILDAFLKRVESGYMPNPYHNKTHAADVLQTFHHMLLAGGILEHLTDIEVFAALIAAAIHDHEHPGLNQNFLVNTGAPHAITYNDHTILEMHHVCSVYKIMQDPQLDIRQGMTEDQKKKMREIIVAMVLATDMTHHFEHVSKFSTKALTCGFDLNDKADRLLVLVMTLKMADISNPAKPWPISLQWTRQITDEFYRQGDKERELGLAQSPLMDRNNPAVAKAQMGFIDFVVTPAMEAFVTAFPSLEYILADLRRNRRLWEETQVEI